MMWKATENESERRSGYSTVSKNNELSEARSHVPVDAWCCSYNDITIRAYQRQKSWPGVGLIPVSAHLDKLRLGKRVARRRAAA